MKGDFLKVNTILKFIIITAVVQKQIIPTEICFPREQYLALQSCLKEWEYLRGQDINFHSISV